jgi:hypothetical protein
MSVQYGETKDLPSRLHGRALVPLSGWSCLISIEFVSRPTSSLVNLIQFQNDAWDANMTGGQKFDSDVILCTHAKVWYVNSVSVPMLASHRVPAVAGSTLLLVLVGSQKRIMASSLRPTFHSSAPQVISKLTPACQHTWPSRSRSSSHPAAATALRTCPRLCSA